VTTEKRARVVLADDEAHCRLLLRTILTSMNCDVVAEARTGAEVMALYREHRPNLLLLDVNMPVKTGDEVLGEILEEFPDAFVIMLTSVTDMESIERCIADGAANYIRKDTPLAEIKTLIKETWIDFVRNKKEAAA
jgi:two-component system, chemotaxis family, chemotaxis protein CheY